MQKHKSGRNKISSQYRKKEFRAHIIEVLMKMLEAFDNPQSLAIAISYRLSDFQTVDPSLLKERDPSHFNDAHSYYVHRQIIALFKKSMYMTYEGCAQTESIDNFFEVDRLTLESNTRIQQSTDIRYGGILEYAREIVRSVIGEIPNYDVLYPNLSFTKGSVCGLGGSNVNLVKKLEFFSDLPVSKGAKPILDFIIKKDQLFSNIYPNFIESDICELFTVPKQYNKVRVAAKGQLGNMLLQRPIGEFFKSRLRRVGIDISKQEAFHKFIVENFWDVYATLDQSDASDRLCVELCRKILPYDWFRLLNLTRHHYVVDLSGDVHPLHKMANQGCGFIFELQTLIYYALAKATVLYDYGRDRGNNTLISVYGDDLICEEVFAPAIAETLVFFGQQINFEKSYFTGRFKESCGCDTYDGFDIRPVYIKQFSNGIRGLYELSNIVKRISSRYLDDSAFDKRFIYAYRQCLSAIPNAKKFFGTYELGDAVLHASQHEIPKLIKKYEGSRTGYYKRGCWVQPMIINSSPDRMFEAWKIKNFLRPSMTDGNIAIDDLTIKKVLRLTSAAIVYALLGGDSNGTVSHGAPVRYVTTYSVVLKGTDTRVWV